MPRFLRAHSPATRHVALLALGGASSRIRPETCPLQVHRGALQAAFALPELTAEDRPLIEWKRSLGERPPGWLQRSLGLAAIAGLAGLAGLAGVTML